MSDLYEGFDYGGADYEQPPPPLTNEQPKYHTHSGAPGVFLNSSCKYCRPSHINKKHWSENTSSQYGNPSSTVPPIGFQSSSSHNLSHIDLPPPSFQPSSTHMNGVPHFQSSSNHMNGAPHLQSQDPLPSFEHTGPYWLDHPHQHHPSKHSKSKSQMTNGDPYFNLSTDHFFPDTMNSQFNKTQSKFDNGQTNMQFQNSSHHGGGHGSGGPGGHGPGGPGGHGPGGHIGDGPRIVRRGSGWGYWANNLWYPYYGASYYGPPYYGLPY